MLVWLDGWQSPGGRVDGCEGNHSCNSLKLPPLEYDTYNVGTQCRIRGRVLTREGVERSMAFITKFSSHQARSCFRNFCLGAPPFFPPIYPPYAPNKNRPKDERDGNRCTSVLYLGTSGRYNTYLPTRTWAKTSK